MFFCRRLLWMAPEKKKKTAKLSMGYKPTIQQQQLGYIYHSSLYRVCITDKESMVIGYHDHL